MQNIAAAVDTRSAQAFWQRYFEFYDTLNQSIPYRRMIERQVDLLEPVAHASVLDAGVGTGNLAVLLVDRGADVTGIDFCESALEKCRRKVPRSVFRFADLTKPLDIEADHFDKVACCCVLHVLRRGDQAKAVREFFRILKPGGIVVITAFKEGFSPIAVYLETLRQHRVTSGVLSTLLFAVRYLIDTTRILYYVFRIQRLEKSGQYDFVNQDGLARMLTQAGFEQLHFEKIFAGQCVTATALKPQ